MKVLLDTCAIAALRHPRDHPAVKAAVELVADDDLFLSVLVLGEIARGIELLSDGRKKRNLSTWLTVLERQFADRILPVDQETARVWGEISVRVERAGLILPIIDGLLAATALRHGSQLMTRNTQALAATGALIVDPWKESAGEA
jgi:toxin FitB